MRVTVSNFVKIGQMVVEILRLYGFSKIAAAAILDFHKFKLLTASTFERSNLRCCAKFHQETVTSDRLSPRPSPDSGRGYQNVMSETHAIIESMH